MTNVLEMARDAADEKLNHTEIGAVMDAADQRALTRQKPQLTSADLQELAEIGEVVARSKKFQDMNSTAQAVIKLCFGRELGLSKMASLTGVHIFDTSEGTRVIISGQLILAKVNNHPDYRMQIVRSDTKACWIQPWKRGGLMGTGEDFELLTPICFECEEGYVITADKKRRCANCAGAGHVPVKFAFEDAERLGLTKKKNWMGDPESMLLWRNVAKTQRRYYPDVLAIGPAYVEGEIDYETVKLPEALAAAAPQVTIQRPRRASEAPPENVIEALAPCDGNHVAPTCADAQCWLTPTDPPLDVEIVDEQEPATQAAPSAAELEICEGGTVINRKCDQCNEKLALKPTTGTSAKVCPKGHGEFTGSIFCPTCLDEAPRGRK